ncbi:transmembrane protein [Cystoisospora suis]|uniref:Transmembrane protein n=1 Tax=Cystoisospora suis TaxID=483139 RepID=A0A2C6JE63_9APIC|nr:transmembrane protein [Cystoisospora suis]
MQSSSREFRHSVRHLPAIKKQASSRPGLFQALLVAWDLFSTSILKFKLFGAVDPEAPGKSVLYFMDLSERLLDLWFKERSFDVTMLWAYLIHSRVVDSKTHRRPQQSTSILLMDGMRDYLFGELPHHKLGAGILYTSRQLDALRLLEDRVKDAVHRKLQNALRRYQSFPLASEATLLLRRETGWLQRIGAAAPEAVFPALFTDKLLPSVQVTGYFLRGERGEEVKTGIFGDGISDELLEELKAGLPAHSALLQLTMVDAWAWHTRSRDPRDSEPAGQRILGETQGQRRLSATVGSASQSAPLPPRSAYAEPADGSSVADASSEQHLEQRGESSPTEFFEQPSAPSCFGEGAASSQPHGLCADPVALDSYLPVTTATQLLNVELRWDPSLLNAIGRTVVLLSDVVDLDNADLHGPEGDPAFDLDVHALLLLPVRDFTGAEGLAQDVVRMVSSGPASSRLPGGGQTTSERAKQLLNPRRVKVLGTARWVGGSAPKLLLGEFGVGICTKGLQDALALLEKGFVLVHLSIAGLSRGFQKSMHSVGETAEAGTGGSLNARRGAEAKATTAGQMSAATGRVWGISAKEAFRRFLRRTKGGAARIVYMQTSAEDGIKAAAEKSQRREGRVPFTGMVISNACVVAFFVLVILYLQWTKRADMPWWITCLCMRSAPWLLADENLDASSVSSSEKEESCNCSDAGDAQVSTAATDEFPVRRKRSSSLTSCRLGAAIAHKASCYPVSVCPPMSEGEQHAASQSYFLSPLAPLPVLKNPRRRTLRAAVAMQRCVKLKRNHGLAASSPESIPCPVGRVSCVSPPQQYRSARKSPSVVGSPLEPYPGPTHVANRLLSGLDWAQKERENSDVNAAVALQSAPRGGDPRIQNYTNGERGDGGAYGAPSKQGRAPWSLEGKAGQKSSRRRGLAFGCRSHTKDNACVSTDSRDAGLLGEQVLGGGGRTAFSKWGWREESVAIPVSSEAAGKSIHLPEYADKRASSKDGVPSEQAQEPHKEEPEGMGQNEEECDLELVVRFVDSDGRRASWV